MDKANYLKRVRAHSSFLNEALNLSNGNIEKLLQAVGLTFGVVTEKLPSGVLDIDLKVEQATNNSLFINPGYAIAYDGSEVRIVELPRVDIDFSSQSDEIDYGIYLVPKTDSYEEGTLGFTNGSKNVTITNGVFSKLDAYESIVIDSSLLSNNGVYEVYQVLGTTSLELVNIFTGTTESSVAWKIAGNFKGYKTAGMTDLIYSYDSYAIIISSQKAEKGILLATVRKSSGVIAVLTDRRSSNLFSTKTLSKTVADEVIKGVGKDITTIEEKASAGSIDQIIADNIQQGHFTGLGLTITGASLRIGSGAVYNYQGKRITIPAELTVNLDDYVTSGEIVSGNTNYLYLAYVSPNSYRLVWNQSDNASAKGTVLIGRIEYTDAGVDPFVLVSEPKSPIKHNVNSLVFREKEILEYQDKELYYRAGFLYYKYLDETVRPNVLREIELVGLTRLNDILAASLKSIAKSEKIRFSLYPTQEKDSWFFCNGIQSPILLGYKHKIVSWKVGTLPAMTAAVASSYVYDYTAKEVLLNSRISGIISKSINLSAEGDATIGVYFYGSGSVNEIRLIQNGNIIAATNMQIDTDSLGQAVIDRLYQVEIVVESTEDILLIDPAVGT